MMVGVGEMGWKFGHIQLLNQQRSLEKEKECLIP